MSAAPLRRNARHWSLPYVGLWPEGGQCWGDLVREVYRCEHGIPLPADSAGGPWIEVAPEASRDFDLVVFGVGRVAQHVGLAVGDEAGRPGSVLHLPPRGGSRIEPYLGGRISRPLKGVYRHSLLAGAAPAARGHSGGRSREHPTSEPPLFLGTPGMVNAVGLPFLDAGRERVELMVSAGANLATIVGLVFPAASEEERRRMSVFVGPTRYDPESWAKVYPYPGEVVTIRPLPGVWSLRTILAITVVVAALAAGQFYLGPLVGAALFGTAGPGVAGALGTSALGAQLTSALVTGALVAAASLAVNAFIPPASTAASGDTKARNSIEGFQNEARPYGVVPAPAGRQRQTPPYGAMPYMEVVDGIVFIRALFILGIGPLAGSGHCLGDSPIASFTNDDAGAPIEMEFREGHPDDAPFTLYDHQVVPTDTMGALIPNGTPGEWVTRRSARAARDLEIVWVFPQGLCTINSTGGTETATLFVELQHRRVGLPDWTVVAGLTSILAEDLAAVFGSYRWRPAAVGQYDVRMRIVGYSANWDSDTNDFERNQWKWLQLYAHRTSSPMRYPVPVAATTLRVRATDQLQGTLDSYNCIVSRIAPDFDPGSGTWITRETANPASYARWVFQGPANAKAYPDAKLILPEFEDTAAFAIDQGLAYHSLVDQDGGRVPDVVSEALGAARASLRYDGVKFGTVIDRPRTIVSAHFTPRNGFDIQITRPRVELPDGWIVSFRDETQNWQVRQRRVIFWKPREEWADPDVPENVDDPTLFETFDIPGKTDPDEIFREGKRRELELKYRPRLYAVSQGWDGVGVARGVLGMLDDGLLKGRVSARVTRVDGNVVELDEDVTQAAGKSYGLGFRTLKAAEDEADDDPPAESVQRAIVTVPGTRRGVVLAGSGMLPSYGDLATFGEVSSIWREVIVSRVAGGDNAKFTCLDHAPEIDTLLGLAAAAAPAWDAGVDLLVVDPSTYLAVDAGGTRLAI